MKTIQTTQPSYPDDLTLAVHVNPGDTYEWSKVLLARVNANGTFELLTAAWEKVLGYGRHEFVGKTLRQLMRASSATAARTVAAILDERNMDPVELTVRSRDGEAKCLRLHRRHDAYTRKMFIVAEETSASESSYLPDHGAVRNDRVASGAR
jgi:PAS domain S-box-containing protein